MSPGLQVLRVLLVDDHLLFRECLKRVLEADPRFQVRAEAATLDEVVALCNAGAVFDLCLVDLQLSTSDHMSDGLAVLRMLRSVQPSAAAMLLTAGATHYQLHEAVHTLAAGVFLKSDAMTDLFAAMSSTLEGKPWISSGAHAVLEDESLARNLAPASEISFTARELLVLRWITEGLSNKEIADQLSISESSVKALLQKLFQKTSVRTRSQVVRYVFESGLVLP